jgi:chloramphenicol O-acetyltransferase type B
MTESMIPPLTSTDSRVTVGRFTYGTPRLKVWAAEDRIEIGAFCSIADDVVIMGGGEHNLDWVTTFPLHIALGDPLAGKDGHPATKGPTRIGNDVWIGHGAIVLSGVTVGDGAVIGAGSVVVGDVLPYQVVGGNPARPIRFRFSENQIAGLLALKWWDWSLQRIRESSRLLCSPQVDLLLQSGPSD